MKYTIEVTDRHDCINYLWGQALRNIDHLTDEQLEYILEDFSSDDRPESVTSLNDLFAYDTDLIAEILGFDSWDDLLEQEKM